MSSRTWFPLILAIAGLAAVSWAVYGSRLPPADFTFGNESEIESVDPVLITGHPEGRVVLSLFEGLTRANAETYQPEPGMAESWDISDDGRTYTFHLREDALWSNGEPVTAQDFLYSFRRLLDPMTAAEYAYQAWYIKNANRYSLGSAGIEPGDLVEVELNPSEDTKNTVRGKVLRGTLVSKEKASGPDNKGRQGDLFVVNIDGQDRRFQVADDDDPLPPGVTPCRQVLLDFREVGVRAIDDRTLEIELTNPTHYWLNLLAFYPLAPVNQKCLETHGSPAWTRPQNIVTNGPFLLKDRRIRDRIRLVKSDKYWDRDNVKLNTVDALSLADRTTAFNMFATDMCDWVTVPPVNVLREVLRTDPPRNDVNPYPMVTTYYYLLNTKRKPLDDVRVRRALSLALDREELTRVATGAGEQPAYSLVPPELPGYTQQECAPHNPELARQLLAEAGYPGGLGFPKLEIHYNTDDAHQAIAELVRKQWQRELGIDVSMRNEEWVTSLTTKRMMNYLVSRGAWGGDYLDANTFLDMFVTDGANNNTGFSNAEYDKLIADAAREPDKEKRVQMLERAERILMDEVPILPLYFYVGRNMVKPHVRGWYNNLMDDHPLRAIWIDSNVDPEDPLPNEFMRK